MEEAADARAVWDALCSGGALFFGQLQTQTELLPTQLEEALRQLAALGLVTCDAFAAARLGLTERRGTVRLTGGDLQIEWRGDGHVLMTGPVATSFTGAFDLDALRDGAAA